jgi:hypothetical protein
MDLQDDSINDPFVHGSERHHGERERVRTRIRVKKKKGPKKRLRKLLDKLIWTIVIIAFILTLSYLVRELDLSDQRFKKKKTSMLKSVHELFLLKNPETA